MKTETTSGYIFENIILTESIFYRADEIDFSKEIKTEMNIETGLARNNEAILCKVTLEFKAQLEESEVLKGKASMTGIFKQLGTPTLSPEEFCKVNAPAIIFPFIREHIASVTAKAGMMPILIHPVNFAALAKQENK